MEWRTGETFIRQGGSRIWSNLFVWNLLNLTCYLPYVELKIIKCCYRDTRHCLNIGRCNGYIYFKWCIGHVSQRRWIVSSMLWEIQQWKQYDTQSFFHPWLDGLLLLTWTQLCLRFAFLCILDLLLLFHSMFYHYIV